MNKKIFFQICLITFLALSASGQIDNPVRTVVNDTSDKYFGLFDNEKILEITLRFDLSTYFRTKPKKDYLKANITIQSDNGDSINADIKLRTRGEFRNQNCSFAPIELNFKKADFGYKDLNRIFKIKLVPECSSGTENSNYVLREYLIYKLYNIFTDTSFRVRLLTINYIDTEKKRKPIKQYGFFIEPLEQLTSRTNTVEIKSTSLTQKNIIPRLIDRVAIFNYMIGNYDWAVPGQHNVKIIKPLILDLTGLAIAVPYDFDWTGLVNASYAIPAEVVGTQNIRERLFVGICRSKEVYMKDLDIFVKYREEFYRVINEFPYLNNREKKDMIVYLDEFLRELDKKSLIVTSLLKTCKNF
jgi:hypothetical protein